jgi:predicted phage terminase large subunit-like protein
VPDVLFGGSRGGGKSDGLLGDFANHAQRWGKFARGILFRRSYDELEEVERRALELYPAIGAVYRIGKRTFFFPNEASLKLRYLDRDADAQRYQGHNYTWAGIDEMGNFAASDPIDKIRATLRSAAGVRCMFRSTANPGGPGHTWVKNRYIDPAPPMTPFLDLTSQAIRIFIPSRLEDNRMLMANDPGYQDRLRDSGPPWLVAAWLKGDWNATPEGGIIKAEWFQRYRTAPAQGQILEVVQSWDTAYKAEQINDPSVCTTWAVTRTGLYLLDTFRKRMEYPALKRAVASLTEHWRPQAVLIEDKASGQSLIQELRNSSLIPVIAIEPEKDKVTRMNAVSAMFEAGRVFLPQAAPWLIEYEIELTTFPLSAHDDQVDSTSQFLRWVGSRAMTFAVDGVGNGLAASEAFGIKQNNDFRGFI